MEIYILLFLVGH